MAKKVRIRTENYDRLMRTLRREFSASVMARTFKEPVDDTVGLGIKLAIVEKDLIWRMNMVNSVRTEVQSVMPGRVVFKVGPTVGYSETVEKGLPHVANMETLKAWVTDKLGLSGPDRDRVAFYLWKKFMTEGAEAHPFRRQGIVYGRHLARKEISGIVVDRVRAVRAMVR